MPLRVVPAGCLHETEHGDLHEVVQLDPPANETVGQPHSEAPMVQDHLPAQSGGLGRVLLLSRVPQDSDRAKLASDVTVLLSTEP